MTDGKLRINIILMGATLHIVEAYYIIVISREDNINRLHAIEVAKSCLLQIFLGRMYCL